MNSPVSCLPDPIQNMKNKRNSKTTKKTKRTQRLRNSLKRSSPSGEAGFAPAAYGVIQGKKSMFPLTTGVGRNMTVVNFELIPVGTALTGAANFHTGGTVLNPGITADFPWLSTIAGNYQKFRWKFLRFIFVPQCPSTTPGSVFLYMSYDYLDSAPASIEDVAVAESSVIGNAWYGGPINPDTAFSSQLTLRDSVFLDVDLSRLTQEWYYVRDSANATKNTVTLTGTATGGNGSLAVSSGLTYDGASRPGTIYYGNNYITTDVKAGNLYMAYACEFCEPISAAIGA